MKSLLDALQEGRLIELPDNNKTKALEYLAALIEAIPDIGFEGGITENVLAREQAHNTGIGKGWACPHARAPHDGELVCSVGWGPTGIDYGSSDSEPVHLLVMYFVPDTQKNAYLKEVSSLAKAIQTQPTLQDLKSLTDLGEVRDRLLDAINVALESTPDARARMIQLEVKHAAVQELGVPGEIARCMIPLSILAIPGSKPSSYVRIAKWCRHWNQRISWLPASLKRVALSRKAFRCFFDRLPIINLIAFFTIASLSDQRRTLPRLWNSIAIVDAEEKNAVRWSALMLTALRMQLARFAVNVINWRRAYGACF